MATLLSLMEQTRQRADMQNSLFIGEEELKGYINASYKELYDILVSRFEDYYSVKLPFQITTGSTWPLPADFYKLTGVDFSISNGVWLTLSKWNMMDRNAINNAVIYPTLYYYYPQVQYRIIKENLEILPEKNAAGTYRLWYVQLAQDMVVGIPATLTVQDLTYVSVDLYLDGNLISIEYTGGGTAGSEVVTVVGNAISVQIQSGVSTAQQILTAIEASTAASALVTVTISGVDTNPQTTFGPTNLSGAVIQVDMNGVNGWEEYVVVDAAIKCIVKEESDPQALMMQKEALLKRIEAMAANRDATRADKIWDVNTMNFPLGGGYFGGVF